MSSKKTETNHFSNWRHLINFLLLPRAVTNLATNQSILRQIALCRSIARKARLLSLCEDMWLHNQVFTTRNLEKLRFACAVATRTNYHPIHLKVCTLN